MEYKTPTGAELRARRERLGWSRHDVTSRPEMRAAAHINGDYLEDDIASMEAMSARDLLRWWSTGAPAYAAALNAEEQRRAAAPLAEPWDDLVGAAAREAARRFGGDDGMFNAAGFSEAMRTYCAQTLDGKMVGAILSGRSDITPRGPSHYRYATLTEPVAPEGVTVRTFTDLKCTNVSINRGCHDDLIATVWHSDARAVSIENEYATPEALRFVADLADYRAAQHAADEQQRKLDAVRAAEEAWKTACAEYSTAHERCNDAELALANAKREAGL